jgi:hypothetical protein
VRQWQSFTGHCGWVDWVHAFSAQQVVPHNFPHLSILLFVVSIASNVHAMVHREDGKAAAIDRVAS